MRIIINVILTAAILGLLYMLYTSIAEPISFKNSYDKRKQAVVDRLIQIRQVQECYRGITGEFAPSFGDLESVMKTGVFKIVQVFGDPDDPTNKTLRYDTLRRPAIDSMKILGINVDSLKYIPYANGATFDISADTMTYQKTLVPIVQVGTTYDKFMGKFADAKYARYDSGYEPTAAIKFGDMSKPNTSGNWER